MALTVWSPIDESKGTVQVAVNPPLEVGVTVDTVEPPKVITTLEIGSNPLPVTVTEVKTEPEEEGLIEMVGLDELPDVEKFQLSDCHQLLLNARRY